AQEVIHAGWQRDLCGAALLLRPVPPAQMADTVQPASFPGHLGCGYWMWRFEYDKSSDAGGRNNFRQLYRYRDRDPRLGHGDHCGHRDGILSRAGSNWFDCCDRMRFDLT